MRIESTEVMWIEQQVLSLPELAQLSGLPIAVLEELLDCGAIAPLEHGAREVRFGGSALLAARTARRLQADLELDVHGLTVALRLLERIAALEGQLQALHARLPRERPQS